MSELTQDWWQQVENFVEEKFKGKTDKGGAPYTGHLFRVAERSGHYEAGLLHDILEDTDTTVEELQALQISDLDIKRIQVLTRSKQESYSRYIDRIIQYVVETGDDAVIAVKIADLKDNLDITRLNRDLTVDDLKRLNKYLSTLKKLKEYISE